MRSVGVVPPATGLAALATALDTAGSAIAQAIEVLRFAAPDADLRRCGVADAADLPVGAADRALLSAHELLLGRPLERTVQCGGCGEWTTLPLGRADVPPHRPICAWKGRRAGASEPSYADILAAAGSPAALLERCAVGDGATLDDLARIEGSLAGPLHSRCIGCGDVLLDDVDVMSLVVAALGEVRATVDREVHLLATAYGWDPETIDALPDDRRRRLADLIAGGAR